MQLQALVLSALAAVALADPASIPASDLTVIAKVLPTSALAYIESHGEGGFSKHVASEFEAGSTPSWFTKLPPSIQTLLVPANASVVETTSISNTTTITNAHTTLTSTTSSTGKATVGHTTVESTKTASAASSASSASASSSSSSGGASMPSAVVGAGIAGMVGIVGLLAL